MQNTPLRKIYVADEPARAHIVKGALESHGIAAMVTGDQPFWADGSMVPKDMRPTIWVAEEDAERAVAILAEIEERRRHADPWTCAQCGEAIEAQFSDCWRCGVRR